MGFYPAPTEAIAPLLKHLATAPANPDRKLDTLNILDPCAGEGLALKQIADGIGADHVYAVELDQGRVNAIKANIPNANVIGPASFLGTQITFGSMSIAYVNPPFDAELGGGKREEQAFAEKATNNLKVGGILVLVCPLKALNGNQSFCTFIDRFYEDVAVYKFPDGQTEDGKEIRSYNEIVVFGKKRKIELPLESARDIGCLHKMEFHWGYSGQMNSLPPLGARQPTSFANGRASYQIDDDIRTWEVPRTWKPHAFKKTMFTEAELIAEVAASPLGSLLKEVKIPPPAAPPLPLDKGHLGLILASGMLDGVVEGPHGVHVVRGSSHKVEYHNKPASSSEANPESGAVTTKDVFSQRMVTVIRVVADDGVIMTFSNEPKEKDTDDPNEGDE
jgi:predicted RNA methylase